MQQLPPADRAAAKAVVKADAAVNASAENEKASSPAEEGAGGGDDPEASNQSVPGTPAENAVINDSQSGPNYAFVVSCRRRFPPTFFEDEDFTPSLLYL